MVLVMLMKYFLSIKCALLGHTISLWMQSNGLPISQITFLGIVFLVPYGVKTVVYVFAKRYATTDLRVTIFFAWLFLFFLTLSSPGGRIFIFLGLASTICGAVFDASITQVIKSQANIHGAKKIATNVSTAEILGLLTGNNVAFFLSIFFPWAFIYQAFAVICGILMLLLLFLSKDINLHQDLDSAGSPTNFFSSVVEIYSRLQGTFFVILFFTIFSRFQNGLLAQTYQLFLREQSLSDQYVSLVKGCGIAGTLIGVLIAKSSVSNLHAIAVLKPITAFLFVFVAFNPSYSSCLIFFGSVVLAEKISRNIENMLITALHIESASTKHGRIQITSLGSIGYTFKIVSEMISGNIVNLINWSGLFILNFVLVVFLSLYLLLVHPKVLRAVSVNKTF